MRKPDGWTTPNGDVCRGKDHPDAAPFYRHTADEFIVTREQLARWKKAASHAPDNDTAWEELEAILNGGER